MKKIEIWMSALTVLGSMSMATSAIAAPSRMRSINATESAPLNSVSRSFTRLATTLETSVEAERLTYKVLDRIKGDEAFSQELRELLVNVSGGPGEAVVANLQIVAPVVATAALEDFLGNLSSTDASQNLEATVKSALSARPDIKLFTADVRTASSETRALLLRDEETNELLIIDLAAH